MKELTEGFRRFLEHADAEFYASLTAGQKPHTLIISCSDSRIIPEHIFDAAPGELFVLRNVGNLAKLNESSIQACVDYAVKHLHVKSVVVMGHSQCGAVSATEDKEHLDTPGLREWLSEEEFDGENSEAAAKAQTIRQLEKLKAYQTIKDAVDKNELSVCAMYFNMAPLTMEIYTTDGWCRL